MTDKETIGAPCPKCHREMAYLTATPHPSSLLMQKVTFVCPSCNRTWSYTLSSEVAAVYASAATVADSTLAPPPSPVSSPSSTWCAWPAISTPLWS